MSTPSNPIQAAPNGGAESDAGIADPEISLVPGEETPSPELTPEPEGAPKPGDKGPDQLESKEDGRIIPGYIRALKDGKPEEYKRAKADFFDLRERRAVHPNVQAARDEHEFFESVGGNEGVAQLREDGAFFKKAAQEFLRGDKAFYADLWEEDQTAAETGLPIMLELAKEKSKDVYDAVLSRIWDQEFQTAGWDRQINALAHAIENGEKDRAIALVEAFHNWRKVFSQKAQRAEDPRLKRMMAERAAEQENKGKTEREAFLNTTKAEAINEVVMDAAKAFDAYFKTRKLGEDDRNDLLREVLRIADHAVAADESFKSQRDKHLENGDANAAKKLWRSRYAQVMPDAIKRVARRYGMLAGAPKPAPAGDKGAASKGAPQQPAQGFVAVNERPQREDIDYDATGRIGAKEGTTAQGVIVSGRAVLKNGRKVSWAHLKAKVA